MVGRVFRKKRLSAFYGLCGVFLPDFSVFFGDVGFEIGACPDKSLSCGHERRLSGAKPPSVHIVLAAGMLLCDAISLLL